jgi:hypothetical protein
MIDNILGSALLALIVALALGAATTMLDEDRPGASVQARPAATTEPEVVRLPLVTVTGHRLPAEPLEESSAKAAGGPVSAPGEKSG